MSSVFFCFLVELDVQKRGMAGMSGMVCGGRCVRKSGMVCGGRCVRKSGEACGGKSKEPDDVWVACPTLCGKGCFCGKCEGWKKWGAIC